MSDPAFDPATARIVPMEDADALDVGRLYRDAIPWAIFSKLGDRFAGRFILWIHQQERSRVWVARSAAGDILGIMGGTLDRPAIYRKIVREHLLGISFSVLLNLYRPGVLVWLFRALWECIRPAPDVPRSAPRPAAEGLFHAVVEQAKGTGLAQQLCARREADFRSWGYHGPYTILTLSTNARANAFQKRLGGRLVAQIPTRGHLIYEWHKDVAPDGP
ncbi:MAG: hypothetical protein ACE5I3_14770 [Phycisphaerae bacterium]